MGVQLKEYLMLFTRLGYIGTNDGSLIFIDNKNDIKMHLKYFFAVISLLFLIQCTNAPSDLYNYEKFHYFDEITLQGMGSPTEKQIEEKEYVFVRSENKVVSVYYPFDDVLHSYYWKDSLWIRENEYEIENLAEKRFEKWYIRRDSFVINSEQHFNYLNVLDYNSTYVVSKDLISHIIVENNFNINRKRFDSIISKEFILENVKNKNSNFHGLRQYYLDNYVLHYPISENRTNGELLSVKNRSRESKMDINTFLTKYPDYRYKINLREF